MAGKRVVRVRWITAFITILVVLIVFAVAALSLVSYQPKNLGEAITNPTYVNFVAISVLGLALGILSSIAYGAIENFSARSELARIQNLTNPELLNQLLQTASEFGNKTCKSRIIRYVLEPTSDGRILRVIGHYTYSRKVYRHRLSLRFVRTRDSNDRSSDSSTSTDLLQQLRDAEFYFVLDEVELRDELQVTEDDPILDQFYSISDFRVDGITAPLRRVGRSDIEYVAHIPEGIAMGQEVRLSYTITFPLSYADYFFSNLQLPTYGNEITLDYRALESVLWVDGVEAFSAMESAVFSNDHGNGNLGVSHSGWALPRSGVMFVWGRI